MPPDFRTWGVGSTRVVEDDIEDGLLIVQAVLTILVAEEVLLDAPGAWARPGWLRK